MNGTEEITQHILYKIINKPLTLYPFPHLYIEDVFSKEWYQGMIEYLPDSRCFTNIEKLGHASYGIFPERFSLEIDDQGMEGVPRQQHESGK
jgi:hypothetical protein